MDTPGTAKVLAGMTVAGGSDSSLAQELTPGPGVDFVFNGE